jgi:type IV pilus assembly protein PilQ
LKTRTQGINWKYPYKNKNSALEVVALKCSTINKRNGCFVLSAVFLLSLVACADSLKETKKDPFFEKWSTMAENSKGHSPAARPKKIDVSALSVKPASSTSFGTSTRQLPDKKITLSMRQAELKSVLRALARSVDLNIIVKNDLKGEVNIDFRGVPWNQAFAGLLNTYGLSYIWEGDILRVMTNEDMDQAIKQKVSKRDSLWVEPLLAPVLVNIDYADTKKLAETLQDFLTKDKDNKPRGSVKVDEHSNSLVISAIREDLAKMLPIIEKIDKPTPQILIKANIVETTKAVARDLGIMWGGMYSRSVGNDNLYVAPGGTRLTSASDINPTAGGPVGIGRTGFASNFPAANLTSTAAGSLALLFGTIGGNILEAQLQALQKDSKLNILSSPSITTLDNQKAFTENGQRVPFVTLTQNVGSAPTQTVTFENAVLRLEITPHVIDGKNLKMKILVQKDELDFTHAASMLGNPIILKKQTETSLIIKDGDTIVISGLTKQTKSDSDTGWPWLKDVPVLGWLFKADSKSDQLEEVLIFIRPHILQVADYDLKAASDESIVKEQNVNTEAGTNQSAK